MGEAIGALAAKGVVSLKSLAQHALTAESLDAEPREEGEDTGETPAIFVPVLGCTHCAIYWEYGCSFTSAPDGSISMLQPWWMAVEQ